MSDAIKIELIHSQTSITISLLLVALVGWQWGYLLPVGVIVSNAAINAALKTIIQDDRPKVAEPPRLGCGGQVSVSGNSHGTHSFGMPSGHTQMTTATFAFVALWCEARRRRKMMPTQGAVACTTAFATLGVAVGWQRYNSKCHSLPQIAVGACLGVVIGTVGYLVSSKIKPDIFPPLTASKFSNKCP